MNTRTALAALTLSTLALPLAGIAPASASHGGGDAVRTHGGCGGPAVWKLKVKPDNGRIEFEAEVDSNRTGQTWRWTLRHDGAVVDTGGSVTRGPSGSFQVERRPADSAGTDSYTFRAVHRATGQVCVARISR